MSKLFCTPTAPPIPALTPASKYDLKLTFDGDNPVQPQILQAAQKFLNLIGAADANGIRQTYAADPFLRETSPPLDLHQCGCGSRTDAMPGVSTLNFENCLIILLRKQ
jgi:hypothetical protein